MIFKLILLSFLTVPIFSQPKIDLDSLGMKVTPDENREFSFTDKKNAYYYARTHANFNEMWFAGWNVNTRRVLKDYELAIDGVKLDRVQAEVMVFPNRTERVFSKAKETLLLFDNKNIVAIKLENITGEKISLKLSGDLNKFESRGLKGFFVVPNDAKKDFILIAPWREVSFNVEKKGNLGR